MVHTLVLMMIWCGINSLWHESDRMRGVEDSRGRRYGQFKEHRHRVDEYNLLVSGMTVIRYFLLHTCL